MKLKLRLLVLFFSSIQLLSCQENIKFADKELKKNNVNSQKKMDTTKVMVLSEEEWKKKLSPEQYYILREKGTERPWTGKYNTHFEQGKYVCAGCGLELFDSNSKFDSHCGWPAFDDEIKKGNVKTSTDFSHGMVRTEIMCSRCGGHLGHVFEDGPTKTGIRYCVNSISIEFEKTK